jgi:CorA-like Mg2+ transporter protein
MLVTILAFVFIPLSLATSFFGMNIQELNSTGQPIWVFLVTSLGILLAALIIWAILYQWTKFLHAPELGGFIPRPGYEASLRTQVKSFVWLIFHGHIVWCWRSGILFSLLTSGRKEFTMTCDEKNDNCRSGTHNPHSPATYIQSHAGERSRTAFGFCKTN